MFNAEYVPFPARTLMSLSGDVHMKTTAAYDSEQSDVDVAHRPIFIFSGGLGPWVCLLCSPLSMAHVDLD